MESETVFRERQRFRQWWLWLILIAVNLLAIFSVFREVFSEPYFESNPSSISLVILTITTLLFTILFFYCRLETTIKTDGIYIRFFPFHLKFKYYNWNGILKSYVRQYSPLVEYGGWGLRFGIFGKGTAFNVSGDKGLQLESTDHKKLLIGTNKPEELTEILDKLGQLKH